MHKKSHCCAFRTFPRRSGKLVANYGVPSSAPLPGLAARSRFPHLLSSSLYYRVDLVEYSSLADLRDHAVKHLLTVISQN